MAGPTIAILGGTGAEGTGLARRFVAAGHPVVIGSRQEDKAVAAADAINQTVGGFLAAGADNAEAARLGELVVLTVPFHALGDTLAPLADLLTGKIVVSTVVPMSFTGGSPRLIPVPEGSAAQQAQALAPGALVVAAFHHISAPTLADLSIPVDADVLVCGDHRDARAAVLALANELPGVRGIDAGRLDGAGVIEGFAVALLRINRRYRAHAGVRVTHLPAAGQP